jgi:hypothetical protein
MRFGGREGHKNGSSRYEVLGRETTNCFMMLSLADIENGEPSGEIGFSRFLIRRSGMQMTTKQKIFWVFGPSVVVTGFGALTFIPHGELTDSIGGLIFLPGWMLSVMFSGNPHRGLGGIVGVVAVIVGSVFAWAFMSSLVLCIVVALSRALRHRNS